MDGTREYHTKQSDRERQVSHVTTYMWHLKYDTSELIYKAETDLYGEKTCLCQGEGVGEGMIGSLGSAGENYSISER